MKKIFFIDRDGTINVEKGYVHKPEDLEFIPGSIEALKKILDAGGMIYIVTNQAGIAKGFYSEDDFLDFNHYFLSQLKDAGVSIQEVLYCPHHPEAKVEAYKKKCQCRKPGNLLLKNILKKKALLAEQAVMIGDRNSDVEAGKSLGIESYLVLTGYGSQEKGSTPTDKIAQNLKEAVDLVLRTL